VLDHAFAKPRLPGTVLPKFCGRHRTTSQSPLSRAPMESAQARRARAELPPDRRLWSKIDSRHDLEMAQIQNDERQSPARGALKVERDARIRDREEMVISVMDNLLQIGGPELPKTVAVTANPQSPGQKEELSPPFRDVRREHSAQGGVTGSADLVRDHDLLLRHHREGTASWAEGSS
jgi:hypothetical protein